MRISDWSSDVCSSDLSRPVLEVFLENMAQHRQHRRLAACRKSNDHPSAIEWIDKTLDEFGLFQPVDATHRRGRRFARGQHKLLYVGNAAFLAADEQLEHHIPG